MQSQSRAIVSLWIQMLPLSYCGELTSNLRRYIPLRWKWSEYWEGYLKAVTRKIKLNYETKINHQVNKRNNIKNLKKMSCYPLSAIIRTNYGLYLNPNRQNQPRFLKFGLQSNNSVSNSQKPNVILRRKKLH